MRVSLDGISNDKVALMYAICALAVFVSPESTDWIESHPDAGSPSSDYSSIFYHRAQNSMHQDDLMQPSHPISVQRLQAAVLIGLFELHRAEFGRAWITASKAVWMAKALRLHNLDSGHVLSSIDPGLTEDARMALWATIGLSGFLSIGGCSMEFANAGEVSSHLRGTS